MPSDRVYSYEDFLKSPAGFHRTRRALFWSGLFAGVGIVVAFFAPFPINLGAAYLFGLGFFALMRVANVLSGDGVMWFLVFGVPAFAIGFPMCTLKSVDDKQGMIVALSLVGYFFVIGLFGDFGQ